MNKQFASLVGFLGQRDYRTISSSLLGLSLALGATACNDYAAGTAADEVAQGEAAIFGGAGTVIGGKDSDGTLLRVCRGWHKSGAHPGKKLAGSTNCNIAWGGAEIAAPDDQGLDLDYVDSSDPDKWNVARSIGNEGNGEALYPCTVSYAGEIYAGKTSPGLSTCHVAYGGDELELTPYKLIRKDTPSMRATPVTSVPTNSTIAFSAILAQYPGSSVAATMRFCIAKLGTGVGDHPGWVRENASLCHYSYGGVESTTTNFYYVVPNYQAPNGSNFYPAGYEADNSALGACRVRRSDGSYQLGKYMPGLQECHYPYGGQEVAVSSGFTVLR